MLRRVALTILLLAFAAPAARAATTTVGELTLAPNAPSVDTFVRDAPVFQGDAGMGYTVAAPRAGTLTSWSFMSGGVTHGNQFLLRVLRPADMLGVSWTAVGSSAAVTVTSATGTDAVQGPFPTNLTIDAGDRIALEPLSDGFFPVESGITGRDGIRFFGGSVADGANASIDGSSTGDNGQVVAVQGTIAFLQNTALPVLSGSAVDGRTLTCSTGAWDQAPSSYAYSWLRDGVVIAGATGASYVLADADVGHALACQVTASVGAISGTAVSATSGPVTRPLPLAPVNTGPPSISGAARQSVTLTASPGLWTNGVTSFAYQWLRCATADGGGCAPIAGATATAYTLAPGDLGSTVRVQVVASNGGGPSPAVVSAPTAVIGREVSAQLSLSPSDTCVGAPTTFDGRASYSPTGIKSYRITLYDLGATFAALEYDEHTATRENITAFLSGGYIVPELPQRVITVSDQSSITQSFDWNRPDYEEPSILARDPIGVELDVTDDSGATDSVRQVLDFHGFTQYSDGGTTGCPPIPGRLSSSALRSATTLRSNVLAFVGTGASTGLSASLSCAARVACTAGVLVSAPTLAPCKPCSRGHATGRRAEPTVLASGVFKIKPGHHRTVRLALTARGRRARSLVAHGRTLATQVTITSAGATGRAVVHHYSRALRPH